MDPLSFWEMVGLFLIIIPVAVALLAAVIFALGWIFWIVIVITFKLVLLALAIAAVMAIGILLGFGG